MAGLKRRIRTEGWAKEVTEADEEQRSFIFRLSNNNKLWVATLILLLAASAFFIHQVKQQGSQKNQSQYVPPAQLAFGSYDDEPHFKLAADLMTRYQQVLDAHYGEGKLILVVPGDLSADNIEHLSLQAAQLNLARFKNRVVVEVYQRSAVTKSDRLVAVTKWVEDRHGFMVKHLRPDK
ncbi:MAG: hypothetical protein GX139_11135 [Armatimonadetes bacterium]|jgi:hypothetical protein|nr:hypothetical protein [Armatimonadota bacterium]